MHVIDAECVELAINQLKGVLRLWFDQWRKAKRQDASLLF